MEITFDKVIQVAKQGPTVLNNRNGYFIGFEYYNEVVGKWMIWNRVSEDFYPDFQTAQAVLLTNSYKRRKPVN